MTTTTPATATVRIPFQPGRCLSPNARCGWKGRMRDTREARNAAYYATVGVFWAPTALTMRLGDGRLRVDWTIAWGKGRRRMDDDNAAACTKPYRDGIADALGVDDKRFATGSLTQMRDGSGAGYVEATLTAERDGPSREGTR